MPRELQNTAVAVEVDHKTLMKLVRLSIKTRRPLMIWGTTGIGKSQVVRDTCKEVAQEMGLEFSARASRAR